MKKILFAMLAATILPAASRSQGKPCIVVKPFQKGADVPWPYDPAKMAEQTAAQLQLKLIKNFTAATEPSQACANPYILEGEILAWHPGNRAKRVLVGVGTGRENAKIRFWLDDSAGQHIFKHEDTIRAEFWGNEYAGSVGELAGPFAAKIADRLKQAKLLKLTTVANIAATASQTVVRERSFMIIERTITFLWQLLLCIAASCFVAELIGYWMHRLLHSNLIPALSRNHLIHHLVLYAPNASLRSGSYLDATENRPAIGNVGLEWLVPSALVLTMSWLLLRLGGVPRVFQWVSLLTMVAWPLFTFNYLHDRMHLHDFWMARHPLFRNWFLRARRLHDIHHRSLRDDGQMDANFGIGFYFFDRVFRTISRRHHPLNCHGLQAAKSILWEPLAEDPSSESVEPRHRGIDDIPDDFHGEETEEVASAACQATHV